MIEDTVAGARAEDLGDGDVTTAATVAAEARAGALITQKAPGRCCAGAAAPERCCRASAPP